ncbi:copper amine oxidase N-terminal domain-containing protein [Alkalihalobacillus oceani]|uniref:Copper amine oxidase N-terminal domain-containing protein n=1 Tax=Halalkalibacter oceani TaxID=1653776 RepID=A0A9X2DRT9_9BACI|nr:copper amine oxidase N-terminal domain-containing protein [Halalkalibacter oceani]MCM3715293.1 copper amine oxidase N-terminal domain-containing protein [Halalkalibacter oceani]
MKENVQRVGKVLKKVWACLLGCLFIVCSGAAAAYAAPKEIAVFIEADRHQFDQAPVIEQGRTLVPLRGVFEALGATVKWNQKAQTVTAKKGDQTIELVIGKKQGKRNGQAYFLDVPPKVIHGRTMVPLRFISEALGYEVKWDSSIQTVFIGTDDAAIKVIKQKLQKETDDVRAWLGQKDPVLVTDEVNGNGQEPDGILFCEKNVKQTMKPLCL